MRALIGVNICPAALNRRSHAALADRGVFVSKNSRLMSGPVATVIVSVDGLGRYSSSCVESKVDSGDEEMGSGQHIWWKGSSFIKRRLTAMQQATTDIRPFG